MCWTSSHFSVTIMPILCHAERQPTRFGRILIQKIGPTTDVFLPTDPRISMAMDQTLKDQKVDHELCQLCYSRAFGFRGSELCWKSLPKDGGAKLGRLINVSKDYEKLVFTKKLFVEFRENYWFVPYVVYINAFDCFFWGSNVQSEWKLFLHPKFRPEPCGKFSKFCHQLLKSCSEELPQRAGVMFHCGLSL